MNGKKLPVELIYQIFSLLIVFIIVHTSYVTIIRPQADAFLAQEHRQVIENPDYISQRNIYVVLRDYEQETCFILMLWALSILAYKGFNTWRQNNQLQNDLLQLPAEMPIGPEDSRSLIRRLDALADAQQQYLYPRAMITAIQRFATTRDVQNAATAIETVCDSEADRLESELSTIRYIAWAIPSVGFIGTVRGIGVALSQANRAVEGDITGVTEALGTAFNSTFTALVISIILMFFIHQLQLMQERFVLNTKYVCDRNLISRLRTQAPA